MGGSIGSAIGSGVGALISGSGRSSSTRGAMTRNAGTQAGSGFERFGKRGRNIRLRLDPTIRAGQETFLQNVRGLRAPLNTAVDEFQEGIGGLRDEVLGLRADFEGNQSAFRDATLNPLRENIATRRGALDRELGRTGVRGSFANQSRDAFELSAGRELTDAEAVVENQRINNLGNLLNMDADLLRASLSSEHGRAQMLLQLEESLKGVSTERFAQEMEQLNLAFGSQPSADPNYANSRGIHRQQVTRFAGDLLGAFDSGGDGSAFDSRFGSSLVLPGNPHSA